eukprot:Nk52_evm4s216 gene=Nk52_evmTU4s216
MCVLILMLLCLLYPLQLVVCQGDGQEQEDPLGLSKKPEHVSVVETMALSGYNIVYDYETTPLFERRPPMGRENIVATISEPHTAASLEMTKFKSLQNTLSDMQSSRNLKVDFEAGLGGSTSGVGKAMAGSLGMKASLSQSKTFKQMINEKQNNDRRYCRVSISARSTSVILNVGALMLEPSVLEDMLNLPRFKENETGSSQKLLEDPQSLDKLQTYFQFFAKYGTHYRRKSHYGGRLEFVYSAVKSERESETDFSQHAEQCASGSISLQASSMKRTIETVTPGGKVLKPKAGEQNTNREQLDNPMSPMVSDNGRGSENSAFELKDTDELVAFQSDLDEEEDAVEAAMDSADATSSSYEKMGEGDGAAADEGGEGEDESKSIWSQENLLKDPTNMSGRELSAYCLLPSIRAKALRGIDTVSLFKKQQQNNEQTERRRRAPESRPRGVLRRRFKRESQQVMRDSQELINMYEANVRKREEDDENIFKEQYAQLWEEVAEVGKDDMSEDRLRSVFGPKDLQKTSKGSSFSGKLDAGFSSCMNQFNQRANLDSSQNSKDTYKVHCVGGISCNGLLFQGTSSLTSLHQELTKWVMSTWNYPAYLDSSPNEYILMSELFEDTVHFKNQKASNNSATNLKISKMVSRRKKSMEIALRVYFEFYSSHLDASLYCEHLACSTQPRLLANGDCFCPDSSCRFNLLTRLSQAGGGYWDDSSGILLGGEGASSSVSCYDSEYFDASSGKCRPLIDLYKQCPPGENFIEVETGKCVPNCGRQKEVKSIDVVVSCAQIAEEKQRADGTLFQKGNNNKYQQFFVQDVAPELYINVPDGVESEKILMEKKLGYTCTTKASYCVHPCEKGTYLFEGKIKRPDLSRKLSGAEREILYSTTLGAPVFIKDSKTDSSEFASKGRVCLKKCPYGYKADEQSFTCVSKCLMDAYEKYDRSTGQTKCVNSCATDFSMKTPLRKICVPNTILGFYNATVHLGSFPALPCAVGNVSEEFVGNVFLDGSGSLKVGKANVATSLMITSVHSNDLEDALNTLMDDTKKQTIMEARKNVFDPCARSRRGSAVSFGGSAKICNAAQLEKKKDRAASTAWTKKLKEMQEDFGFIFQFLANRGCGTDGIRFSSGSFIKGSDKFGSNCRVLTFIDSRNNNFLTLDPITQGLRYGLKGERPAGFLGAGSLGSLGANCDSFLSNSKTCSPLSYLSSIGDSDAVIGNFFPPLSLDEQTGELRVRDTRNYKRQTFFKIHPVDQVNRISGSTCSNGARISQTHMPNGLKFPITPSAFYSRFSKPSGFGYILGDTPFKMIKVLYSKAGITKAFSNGRFDVRLTGSMLESITKASPPAPSYIQSPPFEKHFFEFVEVKTSIVQTISFPHLYRKYSRSVVVDPLKMSKAYILSDPSAPCFVCCMLIFDCKMLCDFQSSPESISKDYMQIDLSFEEAAKFMDFSRISVEGLISILQKTLGPLSVNRCSASGHVTLTCIRHIFEEFKGEFSAEVAVSFFEQNLFTRPYSFYVPSKASDFSLFAGGQEAVNFLGIVDEIRKEIEDLLPAAIGERKTRALSLLKFIEDKYQMLSFEPKTKSMLKQSKQILNEVMKYYHGLDDVSFAVQLKAQDIVLVHICLHDVSAVRYSRRGDFISWKTRRDSAIRNDTISSASSVTTRLNTSTPLPIEVFKDPKAVLQNLTKVRLEKTEALNIAKPFNQTTQSPRLFGANTFQAVYNMTKMGSLLRANETVESKLELLRISKFQGLNCQGENKGGTFCLMAEKPENLITVKFTFSFGSGHDTTREQTHTQVCQAKHICRSDRVKLSGTDGYLMFVLDYANNLLRFDLLHLETKKKGIKEEKWLAYISHAYAKYDCFNESICYEDSVPSNGYGNSFSSFSRVHSSSDTLLIRKGIHSSLAPKIAQVSVRNIELVKNNSAYFGLNPLSAFVRPCNSRIAVEPFNATQMMITTYVAFTFADRMESEETIAIYLCDHGCERRTLTVGTSINAVSAWADFSSFDISQVNAHVEAAILDTKSASQPRVTWERQAGLPGDKFTLGRYSVNAEFMEAILQYTYPYFDLISAVQSAIVKTQQTDYFPILARVQSRLKIFANIRLPNITKSEISVAYGELYRLSETPGDQFARYYSELKAYSWSLNVTQVLLTYSPNVIARRQVALAGRDLNAALLVLQHDIQVTPGDNFADYIKALRFNATGDVMSHVAFPNNSFSPGNSSSSYSIFSNAGVLNKTNSTGITLEQYKQQGYIPQLAYLNFPVTWEKINAFFHSYMTSPLMRVYPFVVVAYGPYMIEVNRTVSLEQTHCVDVMFKECALNGTNFALIVRYKMDPIEGNVAFQIAAPCVSNRRSDSCVAIKVSLWDLSGTQTGIKKFQKGDFRVIFSELPFLEVRRTQNLPSRDVFLTKAPKTLLDEQSLKLLVAPVCGTHFNFALPLPTSGCVCQAGYTGKSCVCNSNEHKVEDLEGNCVCDRTNMYAESKADSKKCICDPEKGLVSGKPNAIGNPTCVCANKGVQILDSTSKSCICNYQAGYHLDEETQACVFAEKVKVEITSVRSVNCGNSKAVFDYQDLQCRCIEQNVKYDMITMSCGDDDMPKNIASWTDAGSFNSDSYFWHKSIDPNAAVLSRGASVDSSEDAKENWFLQWTKLRSMSLKASTDPSLKGVSPTVSDQLTIEVLGEKVKPKAVFQIEQFVTEATYILEIVIMPGSFANSPGASKLGLNTIVEVNILNQTLIEMPSGFFSGLRNLVTLNIRNSHLSTLVNPDTFNGLFKVTTLDLRGNDLKLIGDGVMDEFKALQTFDVSENDIEYIDTAVFCSIKTLELLKISKITSICLPPFLFMKSNFRIDSQVNRIFSASIDQNTQFKCAKMQVCRETTETTCQSPSGPLEDSMLCIPSSVLPITEYHTNKTEVIIERDARENLPRIQVRHLDFLTFFVVSARKTLLFSFEGAELELSSFSSLAIRHANIVHLSKQLFEGLGFIQKLVLHECGIKYIQSGAFRELHMLKELVITGNNISHIMTGTFSGLTSLNILKLSGNHIESISENALAIQSLETLDLGYNTIQALPENVFQMLINLRILNLKSNHISVFPAMLFEPLANLVEIDIGNNHAGLIEDAFDMIPSPPKVIEFGIFSVLCVPPGVYKATILNPSTQSVFCKKPKHSSSKSCESQSTGCPAGGKVCSSDHHCNGARFPGSCICDQYIVGVYCHVPAATIVTDFSGSSQMYFNIPLYPGSLKAYLPLWTRHIKLISPYMDNMLFNSGLFDGFTVLEKVEIEILVPLPDPIIPLASFFQEHPKIRSFDDVRVITPLGKLKKSSSTYEALRYRRDVSDETRHIDERLCQELVTVSEEAILRSIKQTRSEATRLVYALLSSFASVFQNSDLKCGLSEANTSKDSLRMLYSFEEFLVFSPKNFIYLDSAKGFAAVVYTNEFDSSSSRLVSIVSVKKEDPVDNTGVVSSIAFDFLHRVLNCEELFEVDIIIDHVSVFWPNIPIMCGVNVLLDTPFLLSISPLHYDSKIIQSKDTHNIFFDYGTLADRQVLCEPNELYRTGLRFNDKFRVCYGCQSPSDCEFLTVSFTDVSEETIHQQPVHPKTATSAFRISSDAPKSLTLQEFLSSVKDSVLLDSPSSVSLFYSSCAIIGLFDADLCTSNPTDSSCSDTGWCATKTLSIGPFSDATSSSCFVDELNLEFLENLENAKFNFLSRIPTFILLNVRYYTQEAQPDGFDASKNRLPSLAVLMWNGHETSFPGQNNSFFKPYQQMSLGRICENRKPSKVVPCRGNNVTKCENCLFENIGVECPFLDCPSTLKDVDCSAHGACVRGVCECERGWDGSSCSIPTPGSSVAAYIPCSGMGSLDTSTNSCKCSSMNLDPDCALCGSETFCSNGGVCEQGKCRCDQWYTGNFCQYPLVDVNLRYLNSFDGHIESLNLRMGLKPFMFIDPLPQSVVIPSILKIINVKVAQIVLANDVKGPEVVELPPFTFYGMLYLESIDLSEVFDIRKRFSSDKNALSGSVRAFDGLTNLRTLHVPLYSSICSSRTDAYILKGCSMWIDDCGANQECCTDIQITPVRVALPLKETHAISPISMVNIALNEDEWLVVSGNYSERGYGKASKMDLFPPLSDEWLTVPEGQNVKFRPKATHLLLSRVAKENVELKNNENPESDFYEFSGAKIESRLAFEYGVLEVEAQLPCRARSNTAITFSLWHTEQGMLQVMGENGKMPHPCTGRVGILQIQYGDSESEDEVTSARRATSMLYHPVDSSSRASCSNVSSTGFSRMTFGQLDGEIFGSNASACHYTYDLEAISDYKCESSQEFYSVFVRMTWTELGLNLFYIPLTKNKFHKRLHPFVVSYFANSTDIPFIPHSLTFEIGALEKYSLKKGENKAVSAPVFKEEFIVRNIRFSHACSTYEVSVLVLQSKNILSAAKTEKCDSSQARRYALLNEFRLFRMDSVEVRLIQQVPTKCTVVILPSNYEKPLYFKDYATARLKNPDNCLTKANWERTLSEALLQIGVIVMTTATLSPAQQARGYQGIKDSIASPNAKCLGA